MAPGFIIFIAYVGSTILLLAVLSIVAFRSQKRITPRHQQDLSFGEFVKAVWSMKSIYGSILVHIYDTSTDYIIIISWSLMALDEIRGNHDYENVNMLSLMIPSIILIFAYRIAYALRYYILFKRQVFNLVRCGDLIAILCDVYIFVLIYQCMKAKYLTPCLLQKQLHLLESVFESMPQLVLQSIFLIRTYGTDLATSESTYFIFSSITASLLSIVTRFRHEDQQWVDERASSIHCKPKQCPIHCMSYSCLAVIVWRTSETTIRFTIFTLLWSVVGGLYLVIYLIINIFIYLLMAKYTSLLILSRHGRQWTKGENTHSWILVVLQSVVGIPLRPKWSMMVIRFCGNICALGVIAVFAFIQFECMMCYDFNDRMATSNPYIWWLFMIAIGCALIQPLIFGVLMHSKSIVSERRLDAVETRVVDMHKLNSHAQRAVRLQKMHAL